MFYSLIGVLLYRKTLIIPAKVEDVEKNATVVTSGEE